MNLSKFIYAYSRDGIVGFINVFLSKLGFKIRLKNGIQKRIAGGCHLDIDIPNEIKKADFKIEAISSMYVPGPKFLNYHYLGQATPSK